MKEPFLRCASDYDLRTLLAVLIIVCFFCTPLGPLIAGAGLITPVALITARLFWRM